MFTLRKLEALPPKTRRRKIERLLLAAEEEIQAGGEPDLSFLRQMVAMLADDRGITAAGRERIGILADELGAAESSTTRLRSVASIRNRLLVEMGAEPSEWDLAGREAERLTRETRTVLPLRVYVEDVRSPYNVGSIFRTAECLGAREIILSPDTPSPAHPRAARTARGTMDLVPWRIAGLEALAGDPGVFALETGGTPIGSFAFPASGTVIVGSEELGVSPEALGLARAGCGRVSIPVLGAKRSLNVSVAFGILMHAWAAAVARGDRV